MIEIIAATNQNIVVLINMVVVSYAHVRDRLDHGDHEEQRDRKENLGKEDHKDLEG